MTWSIYSVLFLFSCSHVHCWETGHSFIYRYHGELMSVTDSHQQGQQPKIEIVAHVHIQAGNNQELAVQLMDIYILHGNNYLDNEDVEALETPFRVRLVEGNVKYLSGLSKSNWAANFQKSLSSLISLRYPKKLPASPVIFSTFDDEITGRCENVYDWAPAASEGNLTQMFCGVAAKHRYRVIKTRNFDNCTVLPMFNLVTPVALRCPLSSAICENVQSRSLVERFELCSKDGHHFDIVEAELREDFISLPLGAKIGFQRLKINQTLILLQKVANARRSRRPMTLSWDTDLVYIFNAEQEPASMDAVDVLHVVLRLYDELFDTTKIISRQWWQLQQSLRQFLQGLNTQPLDLVTDFIARRVESDQWSFYVQQLSSTGTAAALEVIKQLMIRDEISIEDAVEVFSTLNIYLRVPSDHVMRQLISLMELEMVKSSATLRQTLMVSVASLVRMACVDHRKTTIRFPTYLKGSFCRDDAADALPKQLVDLLATYLYPDGIQHSDGDRMAALSALNILGHHSLIPVVVPFIEGKVDSNPAVRTKAILTLHKLAHGGNDLAVKILHTVYANPSENYQVRMAAFTLLILSNPDDSVWQSVAVRTWFEPRNQVVSFVYTTLETLAHLRSPLTFLTSLSQKAAAVLKLAKGSPRGIKYSSSYIWSYLERQRVVASYLRLETFSNKASLVPKEIYGRFNLNLGANDFDFLEFEIHGNQIERLLADIFEAGDKESNLGVGTRPRTQFDDFLRSLNITRHLDTPGDGFFHWTVMESVERFSSFQELQIVNIFRGMAERHQLGANKKMQWFQLLPLVNVEMAWANSMGFLNRIRVQGQLGLTLNGHLTLDPQRFKNGETALDAHLNPTIWLNLVSSVGIELDESESWRVASDSNMLHLATLPGHIRVQFFGTEELKIEWSPVEDSDTSQRVVLLHRSHCPYPIAYCATFEEAAEMEDGWLDGSMLGNKIGRMLEKGALMLSAVSFFWLPTRSPNQIERFHLSAPVSALQKTHLSFTFQYGEEGIKTAEGTTPAEGLNAKKPRSSLCQLKPTGFFEAAAAWLDLASQGKPMTISSLAPKDVDQRRQLVVSFYGSGLFAGSHSAHFTLLKQFIGECIISGDNVTTFSQIEYDAQMDDECRYVALASTDRWAPFAILIDHQFNQNQVLHLLLPDHRVRIDVQNRSLTVNQEDFSVSNNQLDSNWCLLLNARRYHIEDDNILVVNLDAYHLQLQVGPGSNILIKAGGRLRGKVQGLCGDLNEESIFEFRGPRRCILSSGSVMAASYQTSWHHPQCRIRPEVAERLRHERKNCPRLEAKFTLLPHIVPHNFN